MKDYKNKARKFGYAFLGMVACTIILLLTSCVASQFISQDGTVQRAGTKDDLWVQANMWMVDQFRDAESVVQFSDKEAGVIKGRYAISHYGLSSTPVWSYATVTITASDNVLYIKIEGQPAMGMYQTQYDNAIARLIHEFKTSL